MDFEYDKPRPIFDPERMKFVGRIGRFIPVMEGQGGARLYRVKDEKCYAVTGTKNHLWLEADMVLQMDKYQMVIDESYYEGLVEDAINAINKFGDFQKFRE